MSSIIQPLDLTIGILSWKGNRTLKRSLKSYRKSGLLGLAKNIIIFDNEHSASISKYIKNNSDIVVLSKDNLGIAPAIKILIDITQTEYFLFLENDWVCVEEELVVVSRIKQGLSLLENGECDVVKYRHRLNYGEPLLSRKFHEGRELDSPEHLLDTMHWLPHPDLRFPEYIELLDISTNSENWYRAESSYANYTNNPSLYKTKFMKNLMSKFGGLDGIKLENEIANWWRQQDFNVVQGVGLFKHDPLQKNGHDIRILHAYSMVRMFNNNYTMKKIYIYLKTKIRKYLLRKRFKEMNLSQRFAWIYNSNHWGNDESASGVGSSLTASAVIREELPRLISKYSISSIFDAPCGDLHWMSLILKDLKDLNCNYIGGDIVESVINKSEKKFNQSGVRFLVVDITKNKHPDVDLTFCRDCLFHLSYYDALNFFRMFVKSNAKYLITTNHVGDKILNRDIVSGDFRLMNLFNYPYQFPNKPLEVIKEDEEREMVLWSAEDVAIGLKRFENNINCLRLNK